MNKLILLLAVTVSITRVSVHASDNKTDSRLNITSKEARNKAVAMRVFEENFNQGKFQVADEILHGILRTTGYTGLPVFRRTKTRCMQKRRHSPISK